MHCLLEHSAHTIRQGRIRKVLPYGVTHLSSELCTHRWYPAHVFLYIHFCLTYFFLTFTLNNVCVSSSAIASVISALAVISSDFARQSPCASRCLYSTHFFLIRTLHGLSISSSASFSISSPATVLSLASVGHTFSASGSLHLPCCPLVYVLDTVPMLSSASFLDRNLATVISLDCAEEKSSLTVRFDSGYTLASARCLSPCSLGGSKVFPLSSVTVLCLSSSYNTDDQPVLLYWTVCLSLLQQILAHQNFFRVCTTYFLHHFRASPGRLRLLRQSNRGRKRLHTLNLELIQHHPFIETRTSPHTQPLSSGPPDSNTPPLPSIPSQRPQTQCGLLRQPSLPASALGKRPIPVSSNVDGNKKQKTKSPPSYPSIRSLHGLTLNIRGMTPEKWESIQELDIFPSLHFIILTEHQLSAQFRPDEIIRGGWDFHAVSCAVTNLPREGYRGQRHRGGLALLTRNSKHFSVKMKSLSGVVNKITGDNCKYMDKRRGSHGHGSGSLPILHQAVAWSLTSPRTIHLTGVYLFPDENQLQEFFDTLIAHTNHPSHEPHIYAGDFNAYTAEELENHVTPQELRTLLRRSGDINPAHSLAPPLTSATVPAANYRGRLLLNMINFLEFIITNGRFPVPRHPLTLHLFPETEHPLCP